MFRESVAERVGAGSATAQIKARISRARDRLRAESLGITRDRLQVRVRECSEG
jgi:hypothetical protein